ncbi:MAG: RNA pseudouridine synthase [Bacteroidetes bacterium HGW-Bacteroidetes-6]|jgi:23S rRNA pseudouridine1911/1915/1917 synthase|nr:MAG: RNA pseudouridine synthase [Bacteroidetes bacterium HGW-Bacteroidetes-6]
MLKQPEEIAEEEKELYEHHRIVVDKGQTQIRIDKFLVNRIENISRNRIQNAAKADCILCFGKPVKSNYKVKPNDEISIVLPYPVIELEILPEDIEVDVIYEDHALLVVNKSPGMVVHPGHNNYNRTLLNALLFHFSKTVQPPPFPLLVHRIDKDTSGLLVVTKEEYAQTFLARQFFDHSIERKYQALVWGDFEKNSGTVSGFIGRSAKDRRVMSVSDNEGEGKWSVTHYKVLERFGFASLIECQLETGRTHQIRAHMRHIGHPIFSDEMYGGRILHKGNSTTKFKQFIDNCFTIMPRQALHAGVLGFIHPTTNQMMHFSNELPADFTQVLEKMRRNSKNP